MKLPAFIICIFFAFTAHAQKNPAYISGKVTDENDEPLPGVSVVVLGSQSGIVTNDSGTFHIKVASEKAFALIFSHEGFRAEQRNFYLSKGEEEALTVMLIRSGKVLQNVVISNDNQRTETGLIKINPKNSIAVPSATGGVEGLIKILVGSNNELTSQYSVRGGNYDENLVYINDYEIYRPYLVQNAQQEGLSFINPELTKSINFYNGGFQAKYGDKISSVLDIQYNTPATKGGSVYVSLLEQGFHLQGYSKNKKLSWLVGVRSKTNRNLLSSQETKGNYVPSAADLQGLLTYQFSEKWRMELLEIVSGSKFTLIPESAQKSTAVFRLCLLQILD